MSPLVVPNNGLMISSPTVSSIYTHRGYHSYRQEHQEQLPPYHPLLPGQVVYQTFRPFLTASKLIYRP